MYHFLQSSSPPPHTSKPPAAHSAAHSLAVVSVPRQAGCLLKNTTSGCPRFTGSTPAKQNSSAQKWGPPVSISPATFHLPWPLKLMHPMKCPFGSTTPTNNFQETQTYRSSYLPKKKSPGFHILLTREARVGKISKSFPRNTLPKAGLHVLLLLNFPVEFLATRKLDTTSYAFLPTASDPLFPVRGFTSLRSPVPGQQWPEPPFAKLEVCRPEASFSQPRGPRH